MQELESTRASNRRALFAFTGVLAALVMAVAVVVVVVQRQHLFGVAEEELRTELALLGELATDALLRSDYAAVEGLVQRWVDRHDHLSEITVVMPNGFELVTARKPQPAVQPLAVQTEVRFRDQLLLTLRATGDFAGRVETFAAVVVQSTVVAVVLILLLSWLLWWTLKRTALQPLESQMRAREQKEQELLERTAALEAALKELESFSYSVSHDLRAPLRAIDGFSHALLEDYEAVLDETARSHLARIRQASQRLGVLIDDMLALAQVSRRELTRESVDLSALAHATLVRLQQLEPGRSVQCSVAAGLHARGDAALLSVVLENLLGNAWKYTSRTAHARIEFDAIEENGETVYRVRDNGAGFDMQFAGKLFGAFERLHRADEFEGAGIGLAIVARVVARHGGRVWAEGRVGEGASFYFTLSGPTAGN